MKITATNGADFKLLSIGLAGFTPPAGYTVTVTGYDASNTAVYTSSPIPITGRYVRANPSASTPQTATFNMPILVRSIILSTANGGTDCLCFAALALSDGTTTYSMLGNAVFSSGGVSADNTLSELASSSTSLRYQLAARESVLTTVLNYDSNQFGAQNISLSFIGRYANLMDSSDEGAGALVAAYRVDSNTRVGAFFDYAPGRDAPSRIKRGDTIPTYGLFAVYEQNKDFTGWSARLSAAVDRGSMTITRDTSLASTEAGQGSAHLNGYALLSEGGYGVRLDPTVTAVSYFGLRHTYVVRNNYAETTDVTKPVTYDDFGQRLTTAIGGVRFHGRLGDRIQGFIGFGGEFDALRKMDSYSGTTAISGLSSFAVATHSNANRLRASASAGLGYQVAADKALGAQVSVRQQAYSNGPAIMSLVKLSVGF